MPDRILRQGIVSSDRMAQLTDWGAETFYRRLMSVVDDYGRYDGRPSMLRAYCYPVQLDKAPEATISQWLAECVRVGLVMVYEVEGKPYVQLIDFNQRIQGKPKWPAPVGDVPRVTRDPPKQTVGHRDSPCNLKEDGEQQGKTALYGGGDVVVGAVEDVFGGGVRQPPLGVMQEFPANWQPDDHALDMLRMQGIPMPTTEVIAGFVGHMLGRLVEPRRIPGEFLKWAARQKGYDRTKPKSGSQSLSGFLEKTGGADDAFRRPS